MKKDSEIFFDSYSMAVKAAYDTYLKINEGDFPGGDGDSENKLRIYLQNEYKKWVCTPLETLDGKTPAEYIKSVNSLNALTEMFTYGAVVCDDGMPEIFLDKLKGYDENAVGVLLEIATQNSAGNRDAGVSGTGSSEEGFLASLMAVKLLGEWKAARAAEPLIMLLNAKGEACDLMNETVRDALVSIGAQALEGIFSALDSGKYSQTAIEYLIMALTDIGKKHRSDKIYIQLKKAFIEMPQKLIAADCLGNYGDGRAIPALRGYLEKNGQQLNKETFYEIISSIKRLGGRTNDLRWLN